VDQRPSDTGVSCTTSASEHLENTASAAVVVETLKRLAPLFQIADETEQVRSNLLNLLMEYPTRGKQVHDANIVATMLAYEIDTLLTLNVEDMKRFKGKIEIVSPIKTS
jgi:predicted nucleic acid-binding protein